MGINRIGNKNCWIKRMNFSTGGWLIGGRPNGLLIRGDHLFLNYDLFWGQWWLINLGGFINPHLALALIISDFSCCWTRILVTETWVVWYFPRAGRRVLPTKRLQWSFLIITYFSHRDFTPTHLKSTRVRSALSVSISPSLSLSPFLSLSLSLSLFLSVCVFLVLSFSLLSQLLHHAYFTSFCRHNLVHVCLTLHDPLPSNDFFFGPPLAMLGSCSLLVEFQRGR